MTDQTDLYLPPELPYPIKITTLHVAPNTPIQRGERLLTYSFAYVSTTTPGAAPEVRFGTWDSPIDGTVDKWHVKERDVLSPRKAKEKPVISVTEPCKHGMQIGGLCALCGQDMTSFDYTGFSDASRASIQMTHSAHGPTVSLEEAQRIERQTAEYLLKSRKLSLIVDLDQTIVHATVDPTVGEWIGEGEAWEARQAKKAAAAAANEAPYDEDEDSDDTVSDDEDEVNPNWEALKDVKKFRLRLEALGVQPGRGSRGKGKEKIIESQGCLYYVKPSRPGWQEFLSSVASKYEMHVYTMGTRAYAEEVCAAIDPDGTFFGGRILSRDESGSMTQKNLRRLFPVDTSMVVIIDDRADVWEWSPNLIKVIPYDFFVGIGDINSTFLPKVDAFSAVIPPPAAAAPTPEKATLPVPLTAPSSPADSEVPSPATSATSLPEAADSTSLVTTDMLARNSLALEAQVEERPLAKKQEELQEQEEFQEAIEEISEQAEGGAPKSEKAKIGEAIKRPPSPKEKHVRKALLKNDDHELQRVKKLLDEVHARFFAAYDKRQPDTSKGKWRTSSPITYDATSIIPRIRSETLAGVHILFSSVIPLDVRPETTEIWRMAQAFGATCHTELSSRVTHVVAAKRGTVKVDAARKMPGIKVVWLAWFTDSVARWARQDEGPYLMVPEPPAQASSAPSPTLEPQQISSDTEPDADDWDVEGAGAGSAAEELVDEVDWALMNDEVDAAMNESDSESESRAGEGRENGSDDGWTDESNSIISSTTSTPKRRKRLRSLTPSEAGLNGAGDDVLRSPLAKRKKIVADRKNSSKLKEAISMDELENEGKDTLPAPKFDRDEEDKDEVMEEAEDEDAAEDIDDDFLARELEEELG
ncbi:hypothetical protein EWM64_g1286 [Hericium alpestre]|uniref:RNA polymerase II subunit A C-terminal domain phosphatase n=1 Tax=Hericium alpestre TaxID=135208 RepID=A0A4Z0A8S4_9AGAM|nr:hypothetical protein EWM64_g1286 [Hericium alpestre]